MASGGRREGAGKPKGSTNHVKGMLRIHAIKEELDPLIVIYSAMKEAHEAGQRDDSVRYAKEILPYIHGKQKDTDKAGDQTTKITGVTFTIKPE